MDYGYMRLSGSPIPEREPLLQLGIPKKNIYIDILDSRTKLRAVKKVLNRGDRLYVKRVEQLGDTAEDVRKEWYGLLAAGVIVACVEMPVIDTGVPHPDVTTGEGFSSLIVEIMLHLGMAEREAARRNQNIGLTQARIEGKRLGRPPVRKPRKFDTVYGEWCAKQITTDEALKRLRLKLSTFRKFVRERRILDAQNPIDD